jgi:hypothetical protein
MSFDAISGLSGSNVTPHDRAQAVPQFAAATMTQAATQGEQPTALSLAKPGQPILLVPTQPLSPTVLAELVGRQLSLSGPPVGA